MDNLQIWKYSALISQEPPSRDNFGFPPRPLYQVSVPKDNRIEKLSGFLNYHKSPLTPYVPQIIEMADIHNLDWKLLVAISGVESGFGRVMPHNSYNAYGWSGGSFRFESWEKSIEHVSRVLGEKYIKKGLDTPEEIATRYCPGSTTWAGKVNLFMKNIEDFTLET